MASNWLLRFGILIVVVGVGFFLKYAIDTGLLQPAARVSLSILAGVAMIAAATRLLRGKYHLFGQGLLGGGLAVLYFSIFAAFNFYGFLSQFPAFVVMALITVAAGLLAIRFNSLLIAILGLIGGYGTPIMLSTGSVDFAGLYTYLLLLGGGVFITATRRKWHLLNSLSLVFTYVLAIVALGRAYETTLFWTVMPFFAGFFILFSTMSVIRNLAGKENAPVIEVLTLFVNAGVFFAVCYLLTREAYSADWAAYLTVGLAVFYTGHVYYMLWCGRRDRGLVLSFLALATFFLSITMPLLLSRAWITVSWAVEALVLLWLAAKMQSRFLAQLAYILYVLVLGRFLFFDLHVAYHDSRPAQGMVFADYLANLVERLVAFGVPIVSFALAGRLLRREIAPAKVTVDDSCDTQKGLLRRPAASVVVTAVVVMLFLLLQFEVNRSLGYLFEPLRYPLLTAVWVGLGLFLYRQFASTGKPAWGMILRLAVLAMLLKLFVVDLLYWQLDTETFRFDGPYSLLAALMRLLDFGFVIAFLCYVFRTLSPAGRTAKADRQTAGFVSLALLFVVLTLEVNTCLGAYVPGLRAGGISIVWSVFALSTLVAGILRNTASLRYTGLGLFAVVVGKIFLADLAQLEPVYRIVAFIVLGILTLCGSFVYLKFRQLFEKEVSDEAPRE